MPEKRKGYIILNKLERYSYLFYVLLRVVRLGVGVQQSAITFQGLRVEFWKRPMDELCPVPVIRIAIAFFIHEHHYALFIIITPLIGSRQTRRKLGIIKYSEKRSFGRQSKKIFFLYHTHTDVRVLFCSFVSPEFHLHLQPVSCLCKLHSLLRDWYPPSFTCTGYRHVINSRDSETIATCYNCRSAENYFKRIVIIHASLLKQLV